MLEKIFKYGVNEIRTQVDSLGNPWFCVKDVCTNLHLKNVTKATKSLDDKERGLLEVSTLGGGQIKNYYFVMNLGYIN
jgi:prophage antirepressor-like protein